MDIWFMFILLFILGAGISIFLLKILLEVALQVMGGCFSPVFLLVLAIVCCAISAAR